MLQNSPFCLTREESVDLKCRIRVSINRLWACSLTELQNIPLKANASALTYWNARADLKISNAITRDLLTSERAQRAMRFLPLFSGNIWVGTGRRDHITLLASLYLWDCAFNFQAVFTCRLVHSSYLDHSRNWLIWGFTLVGSACRVRGVKIGR